MSNRRIPHRWLPRAASTGRVAVHLGRAAARRVVGRSGLRDAQLGEALFHELDQLKGMAMKVGQILSYMDVGLPEETKNRLALLQKGVHPLEADVVRRELQAALGAPVEELFDAFVDTPVAAASVGQVHRATLEGRPVAVKLRYPHVQHTIEADFGQLQAISRLASIGTAVDGPALVAELRRRMVEECDYGREARWQRLFGRLFADDPGIDVPEVLRARCAENVLTTAWREGDDFEALQASDPQRRHRAALGLLRFSYVSVLGHGVLQADPHPGNFLFPAQGPIVALDFGCVRRFEPQMIEAFRHLTRVVLDGDRPHFVDAVVASGQAPRPHKVDFDALWDMLRLFHRPYTSASFTFERGWWERCVQYTRPTNRNLRHQGLPPAWLWLQRMQWGLHAVLVQLGVVGSFGAALRDALDTPLVLAPDADDVEG